MFIYGRWADQNESRVLCACRRVLNYCLQVLFILIQGYMLVVGWNACVIGTEENSLSDVSQLALQIYLRFQMGLELRLTYHEPHISRLRRREELVKDLDSMGG